MSAVNVAGIAERIVKSPLTKKIAGTVAGAVASYVTQIYVGKAYDALFVNDVSETEALES
jgi:hypothetical protein